MRRSNPPLNGIAQPSGIFRLTGGCFDGRAPSRSNMKCSYRCEERFLRRSNPPLNGITQSNGIFRLTGGCFDGRAPSRSDMVNGARSDMKSDMEMVTFYDPRQIR